MAINVSLAVLLVPTLELAGIGLAIAVGSWTEVAVLVLVLRRRIGGFDLPDVVRLGAVALGCAIAATAVAWVAMSAAERIVGPDPHRPVLFLELGLVTALAGLVYLGLSRALRIPELGTIVRLMSDALRRPARS